MRKDLHVLREIWQALEEGRLSAGEVDQMVLDHLLGLCATCESELVAFKRGQQRSRYEEVFSRTLDWAAARQKMTVAGAERARADLRALLSMPEGQRLDRIGRARTRFRGVHLADGLLEKSWECLPSNPQGALHWATLAEAVVERSREPGAVEARVLAFAYEANALRILSRFDEARRAFNLARHYLSREGLPNEQGEFEAVTDLAIYAKVDWLEGAFFRTIRDFAQSEFLLSRAALFFGLVDAVELQTKVLVTLGELHRVRGDLDEAIRTIGIVLERVDRTEHPGLYFNCRFNYALYLAEAELFTMAREEADQLAELAPLYADEPLRIRLLALDGRIGFGLGDYSVAERAFLAARARLIDLGNGLDAAIASVDLALLYRATNRYDDLRRISAEMGLIFGATNLHSEAAAALILFQEAVREESASAAFLQDLRLYLEHARRNPELPFRRPH